MWTFDRVIVALGVVIAFITAISPVLIAIIGSTKKQRDDPKPNPEEEKTPVVQGMTVNMTTEYVDFLKAENEKKDKELEEKEREVDRLRYERDLAHHALREHGLPIPVIYPHR